MLVLKRSRSLYMRNHQSTKRFSLKHVWNGSSTSVKIGTHMCVLHAKLWDLFVSKTLRHRSLLRATVMKIKAISVWKRIMSKIKPLRASYQLITDTELCFSPEVNRDNKGEISPDVCSTISNRLWKSFFLNGEEYVEHWIHWIQTGCCPKLEFFPKWSRTFSDH